MAIHKAKIFLVGENDKILIPMEETPYAAEDILQTLLEDYPDLIPGDQINPDVPRRWLFVKREAGVPSAENSSDVWSLDHLFLDQDGVPTLIECKRASDTRIRREVVAQMLDYAANGTQYWPMERLRQDAAESAKQKGLSLDTVLAEIAGLTNEDEINSYWQIVEKNLREGKVRLVFVADEIPRELQRLVEFMNEKMNDIEVLAVEVKQFLGGAKTAVVPRVIGLTEAARQKSERTASTPQRSTNRQSFLESLPAGTANFFTQVLDEAESRGFIIYWGTKGFSLRVRLESENRIGSFAYGWPHGGFEFYFSQLNLADDEAAKLRADLLAYGVFREAGKFTLSTKVAEQNVSTMLDVYRFILNRMEELAKG